MLAFQSLAALALRDSSLHVQEWPFFSSARRGANIRSFLRMSRRAIDVACEVTRPTIALLMDESAGRSVDFAQGVPRGGTFVLNTRRSPEDCARHYRLTGRVFTVPGDDIGTRHLKHPIGNVSTYVALVLAIGGFDRQEMVDSFLAMLVKRRIPQLSRDNRTADYARSGFRLRFEDPATACTGCAHCVTNCPEGIIHFRTSSGSTDWRS
ncbi:MAG TPA: 2-oxoacid:acceptor oxidoreductase family protein [Candidatus Eisenbacteria bacterium]|nr:2-oxoacid:acceptor oxidoreductase family protein [Candidatus Eisenbacteria bacterium]